jgi:hypothetical protein
MLPTLSRLVPPTGGSGDGNANNSALGEILVNPDLVAILVNNAARANEESDRYTAVDDVLQIAKTTLQQMAAVYLVAFKQWGEQVPDNPGGTDDDKYHAVVIYTWILRKAVARQQWAPNNDWAAMFDTLLENRYPIRTDDQRAAAAYTVALQWCGVSLPDRPPGTSEDDYNTRVIQEWTKLRAQRDDPVRNAPTMTTFYKKALELDGEDLALALDLAISNFTESMINLIKDPGTNVYRGDVQNGVVMTLVGILKFYDLQIAMLNYWVALVGRPDYDSSLLFYFDRNTERSLLTYVVGDMQPRARGLYKKSTDTWDKYMTVVNRSVETAGSALNKIYQGTTPLTRAILRCSDFGSESWRHVINTQMVEDMGKLPLSNIASKHPELRCFSVVAALLNAKGIDVVGTRDDYTPLFHACSLEYKWPIVVHLLDMLEGVPNNRLNDIIYSNKGYTALHWAVIYSPGAVIALVKQPELKPDMTGQPFEWKTRLNVLETKNITQYNMVVAALRHVGATVDGKVEANTPKRTVREYLENQR